MGIISGLNIGNTLSQTIFGASGQAYPDTNRVPMSFTSTKRLRQLDPEFSGFSNIKIDTSSELKLLTSQYGELPIIEMAVNPNSITWRQPKRITKRDTQNGSIFFHFTNSKRQNNDILTLDFRGNTGIIDQRSDIESASSVISTSSGVRTGANKRALLWHNLWALTREEILLEDNIINEFMITYQSVIIPIQIMLIGFFSNVMDWTDSADKPFSRDYNMSFTVQEVIPPLEELTQSLQTVLFDASEVPQSSVT